MKVYEAIAGVMSDMAAVGIDKSRKNAQQGYSFRGIDDVYSALAPVLSKRQLCILPRVTNRDVMERPTKSGGVMIYTVLTVEFDIVSAEDGSKHTVCTVGEASDSGDKSSNKAMSAAYKYMAFQAFCIPLTGEDNDADLHSPEFSSKPQKAAEKPPSAYQAKKDGVGPRADEMIHEVRTLESKGAVDQWVKTYAQEIAGFPENWQTMIKDEVAEQRKWLAEKSEQPA